jgi:N-acetylglucosaminyldiphosphoundecaprenol N-acetyl-beta-D-mannosaminyltransferase
LIIPLMDVPTTAQSFAQAIETLLDWAKSSEKRYVSTCPVYTLMMAQEIPAAKAALENAAMVCADGLPIVLLQRQRGYPQAERVYGPDILLALAEKGQACGLRHYFFGGLPEVADKLVTNLQKRFPALLVAGYSSPPMLPLEDLSLDKALVEELNQSQADVIWVGLGSPKQDIWMAKYRPYLNAPLLIGVGAAFDFLAGTKAQAPKWMRDRGLEWLFRLLQEPRRLGKRYLVYNSRFLWALWRESRKS